MSEFYDIMSGGIDEFGDEAGESFTYKGKSYVGIFSVVDQTLALMTTGYRLEADLSLVLSKSKFPYKEIKEKDTLIYDGDTYLVGDIDGLNGSIPFIDVTLRRRKANSSPFQQ